MGVLLVVELAQGVVGFVQYWTDLPVLLVGLHLVGACLVLVTAVQAVLALRDRGPLGAVPSPPARPGRDRPPREAGDLPALVAALRAVHERDGYPVTWKADPAAWLTRWACAPPGSSSATADRSATPRSRWHEPAPPPGLATAAGRAPAC